MFSPFTASCPAAPQYLNHPSANISIIHITIMDYKNIIYNSLKSCIFVKVDDVCVTGSSACCLHLQMRNSQVENIEGINFKSSKMHNASDKIWLRRATLHRIKKAIDDLGGSVGFGRFKKLQKTRPQFLHSANYFQENGRTKKRFGKNIHIFSLAFRHTNSIVNQYCS